MREVSTLIKVSIIIIITILIDAESKGRDLQCMDALYATLKATMSIWYDARLQDPRGSFW